MFSSENNRFTRRNLNDKNNSFYCENLKGNILNVRRMI